MNRFRIRLLTGLCLSAALIFALACIVVWRLQDLDLSGRRHEQFSFSANASQLEGTLWLPEEPPRAAVVLVHGDGPQDRSSNGGYAPQINSLLEAGIAVASWDKPGVGASRGNWLDQSMQDRAAEVREAISRLKQRLPDIAAGALGYSQAGWVIPELSPADADFAVLVGAAVSWQNQGRYYTRTRLRLAGATPAQIGQEMTRQRLEDERLFADPATRPADLPDGLGPDRWRFIKRNRSADASKRLQTFSVPLLAVWGAEDLNVDPHRNASIYRELVLKNNEANKVVVLPDATHGLLKSGPYNSQLVSEWGWPTTLRFLLEGRHAFAPGSFDIINSWILARAAGMS